MDGKTFWALLCSTSRARILRGLGPTAAPRPPDLTLRAREENLRALLTGRFGPIEPVQSEGDVVRHPLADDARAFAALLAELLEVHRRAGELTRLAVLATPGMHEALGEALTNGLRCITVSEVAADALSADDEEVMRRAARMLRLGLWC